MMLDWVVFSDEWTIPDIPSHTLRALLDFVMCIVMQSSFLFGIACPRDRLFAWLGVVLLSLYFVASAYEPLQWSSWIAALYFCDYF